MRARIRNYRVRELLTTEGGPGTTVSLLGYADSPEEPYRLLIRFVDPWNGASTGSKYYKGRRLVQVALPVERLPRIHDVLRTEPDLEARWAIDAQAHDPAEDSYPVLWFQLEAQGSK